MDMRMKSSIYSWSGAIALSGMLVLGSGAAAAARAQHQPAQSSQQKLVSSSDLDDQTLEQFTRSYLQVKQIQQKQKADLADATDPAKAQQIRKDASQQMADAITSHQLTVDKFNAILKSIPKDEDLGKRFVAMQTKLQERK